MQHLGILTGLPPYCSWEGWVWLWNTDFLKFLWSFPYLANLVLSPMPDSPCDNSDVMVCPNEGETNSVYVATSNADWKNLSSGYTGWNTLKQYNFTIITPTDVKPLPNTVRKEYNFRSVYTMSAMKTHQNARCQLAAMSNEKMTVWVRGVDVMQWASCQAHLKIMKCAYDMK